MRRQPAPCRERPRQSPQRPGERPARHCVVWRTARQARGRHERPPGGPPQPEREQVVALHERAPLDARSAFRRVVVGHHVGGVDEIPAGGREVERQQALLTDEEQQVAEAAGPEVGGAPHHRAARHEPQHQRPGKPRRRGQRAARHLRRHRVEAVVLTDVDAGRDQPEPRVAGEVVGGPVERTGSPPGVVVGEGDDVVPGRPGAECACGGPPIRRQLQYPDVRERPPHGCRRSVRGAVVDHDHLVGPACRQPLETVEQALPAVPGRDHDRDPCGDRESWRPSRAPTGPTRARAGITTLHAAACDC